MRQKVNMDYLESELDILGFQEAAVDMLAIIRHDRDNEPRENFVPDLPVNFPTDLSKYRLILADSFNFNLKQDANIDNRFAGESAESNTFYVSNISTRSNFNLPLRIPDVGFVDPAFDLLWDCCRYSIYGTATLIKANVLETIGNKMVVDNVSDFVSLSGNLENVKCKIYDIDGNIADAAIVGVIKSAQTVEVADLTLQPVKVIAYLPRNNSVERIPSFSMISLREGMLSPCLVDKIEIQITQGEPISVKFEIASIGNFKEKQIITRTLLYNDLLKYDSQINAISHIVNGSTIRISPASSKSGAFGLSTPLGDDWFKGYQSLRLPVNITGLTITIENKLVDAYALHSISLERSVRQRENSFPYAIVSEGRKISGNIKYISPLNPIGVMERLAGPSALVTTKDPLDGSLVTGGLIVDFGGFKLTLPELVWSPSSSSSKISEFQDRTINWALVSDGERIAMPELEISELV